MDDETLQIYIEESKEHLETIEADLLEIERGGADIDEDLVNKVFRAAHSIKGGGGFLALDNIKELAHKIENILDLIRSYKLTPTSDIINTLLTSFDRLGELLDNAAESNEEDIEENIAELTALTSEEKPATETEETDDGASAEEEEHTSDGPSFTVSPDDISKARAGGKELYVLEYDLIKDVHLLKKTPQDIFSSLEDAGEIVSIQPQPTELTDLDRLNPQGRNPLYILFASIIEPDLIGSLLDLSDDRIVVIEQDKETEYSALNFSQGSEAPALAVEPEETTPRQVQLPSAAESRPEPPKTEKTAPAPSPDKTRSGKKENQKALATTHSESLRVPVSVLDQLMNRAGELVLSRNALLQAITTGGPKEIAAAGQRIDLVTSEIQEAIMLTRMQPVANIFNKYTRVVRDLARDLGKEIEITLEGKDVELDKTIIEGLGDPLTHLVRNSCDHGIESPAARREKGKPECGQINLRAFHESGQVIIEIEDDGKGLDPEKIAAKALAKGVITEEQVASMSAKEKANLIMKAGFSTSEQVSDVSGRGVGMDVVKSNLDRMGGQVELISEVDKGTTVRIKLPLTLAIMPSILVSSAGERFALPQVNVAELLRIPAAEIRDYVEKVGSADILYLRGELIPLLQLGNIMNLCGTYYDPRAGEFKPDRRKRLTDGRMNGVEDDGGSAEESGGHQERRQSVKSDVNIVVLQAGSFRYGLVVDAVHDTVEIVVKPLGRHLKDSEIYAGATIMGDGHVALILDAAGLARSAELGAVAEEAKSKKEKKRTEIKEGTTRQTLLVFHNGPEEYCAVPLHLVLRVEQIQADDIEFRGGKKVIRYRDGSLPVYALEEAANVDSLEEREEIAVILFRVAGREVGLLAVPPLEVIEEDIVLDEATLKQTGISGSAIIRDQTTLMVDIFGLMEALNPDWFANRESRYDSRSEEEMVEGPESDRVILLAEDSSFFRAQVKNFILSEGYEVIEAPDGKEAWHYLNENPKSISLVVTDIEMPNLNGFELTQNIKTDERFSHLPVIALTSLAGEEDVNKGKEVGIDDYQVKLDKEQLLQKIYEYLSK